MSRVEIEADAHVWRPSEHPVLDQIIVSIDRHGFAEVTQYFQVLVDWESGVNFKYWLQYGMKKYGWEVMEGFEKTSLLIFKKTERSSER